MAGELGMGTITARSVARWRSANGKRAPWPRKHPRGVEAGDVTVGTHPTKGWGWHSRSGKRANRA